MAAHCGVGQMRPTHFVSFRIPSSELHSRMVDLQKLVTIARPELAACCVPAYRAHLTCFVLTAVDSGTQAAASDALIKYAPAIFHEQFKGTVPAITFQGMSRFSDRVLYAEVIADEDRELLCRCVMALRERFVQEGLLQDDKKSENRPTWTPHLTLMKTSAAWQRRQRRPPLISLDDEVEQMIPEHLAQLGRHEIRHIELCAMSGQNADGYYKQLVSLPTSL
eukprot:6206179-Pleurochrysis_carterae.AAC.1